MVLNNFLEHESYHFVFFPHSPSSKCLYLIVYDDHIVIVGNDETGIRHLALAMIIVEMDVGSHSLGFPSRISLGPLTFLFHNFHIWYPKVSNCR